LTWARIPFLHLVDTGVALLAAFRTDIRKLTGVELNFHNVIRFIFSRMLQKGASTRLMHLSAEETDYAGGSSE
jgi:hypothetical protein